MRTILQLLCMTLLALTLAACLDSSPHPPAQELIANFQQNKAGFEELRQMFMADVGLERVDYDFTRPADPATVGVSETRLQEYRTLFDQLHLTAGIEGYGDKSQVIFLASTRGLSIGGSGKGYAYVAGEPELVVDDIDTYRSPDGRSFTAYQPLDGNWYLYYDYED